MLLADFIKNKIHKRGVLLNEDSSEELTIEFLNDMTEARIITTDEEKSDTKSFTENIISKHRIISVYNNFNYELAQENQHSPPINRFHQFQRWITQIPNRRTQTTTLS